MEFSLVLGISVFFAPILTISLLSILFKLFPNLDIFKQFLFLLGEAPLSTAWCVSRWKVVLIF
jgi:hypothetical protein